MSYQIQGTVGSQAAGAIQEMLVNFHRPDTGIIATGIGLVTLLLGAAGLFAQLQDALDTIWEVAPEPGQGILSMIRQRFISFTMVLGIGFQVYARTYGSRIVPSESAVNLSESARIQQGIPRTKTVDRLAAPKTDSPDARRAMVEHQRLATLGAAETPEPHLGMVILGICAAMATFVLGLLISGDQKSAR